MSVTQCCRVALVLLLGSSLIAQAQSPSRTYAITDVLLMDGREAQSTPSATVVVEDGVITAAGNIPIPDGIPVLPAPGLTLMPGFVDLHIHLDLIGHGDYDRFYTFVGGTERLGEVMPIAAKQMLRAGVTTAVDLGSPFDILAVRTRIRAGDIPGTRQRPGLDWTIVRPSALTDDPAGGAYKVDIPSGERGLALKIARADVAGFLARCLGESAFMHRAVGISH